MPFNIIRNDITTMKVDVIVNSANPKPQIGGGVDFAIHEAGGKDLIQARIKLGDIRVSEIKITEGYNLNCNYVFHTVGPVYSNGNKKERDELYACYWNCLVKAKIMKAESIAFPLISAGIFGYPKQKAIGIATEAIKTFLSENEMQVYLVLFDQKAYDYSKLYFEVESYISSHIVDSQQEREDALGLRRRIKAKTIDRVVSLNQAVNFEDLDITWQEELFNIIDSKNIKDSDVYKKANIDRRHFSKIRNDKYYHPSKITAVALAIALELDLNKTQNFLEKAGYSLTKSLKFDLIIIYFLEQKIYDIFEINNTLFEFDQELLGL